jgi:DNA-binding transcriptional regulator LsrR (DeoR family)
MGSTAFEVHANQLVHDLAQKLQASCQFVYAPALVADVEMKRSLESNGAIRSVFDVARTADFALLGISSPKVKNYTLKRLGYISEEDLRKLEEAGVMGDVNLSFFDRDGRPMDDVLDSRIVGLGIDDIKPIEKRATVCFVPSKTEALYVALSSGITNYVAMTDSIARELLRMREKDVS